MTDHLQGPWTACLSDSDGFVVDGLADIEGYDVTITIRRATALPDDEGRLPGSYRSADLIEIYDDYLEEDGGTEARWAQAQAMTAGLNTAWATRAVSA